MSLAVDKLLKRTETDVFTDLTVLMWIRAVSSVLRDDFVMFALTGRSTASNQTLPFFLSLLSTLLTLSAWSVSTGPTYAELIFMC